MTLSKVQYYETHKIPATVDFDPYTRADTISLFIGNTENPKVPRDWLVVQEPILGGCEKNATCPFSSQHAIG